MFRRYVLPSIPLVISLLLALAGSAKADAAAGTLEKLFGTWNVTCKLQPTAQCGDNVAATNSYQWLVSGEPDGRVSIAVLGETNFPRLSGSFDVDRGMVFADGPSKGPWLNNHGVRVYQGASIFMSLRNKHEITGGRIGIGFKTLGANTFMPCASLYVCSGKKN
jgi:hypothetical protein